MILPLILLVLGTTADRVKRANGQYRCYKCEEQFENGITTRNNGGTCKRPVIGITGESTLIEHSALFSNLAMEKKEYDMYGCMTTKVRFYKNNVIRVIRGPTTYNRNGCEIKRYQEFNPDYPDKTEYVQICNTICTSDLCNGAQTIAYISFLILLFLL